MIARREVGSWRQELAAAVTDPAELLALLDLPGDLLADARRASGSVKLPSPQNQSITRSCGRSSSRRMARSTSTRLMCGFTCVKSVGRKGMVMPNSGSEYDSSAAPSASSRCAVSGPLG